MTEDILVVKRFAAFDRPEDEHIGKPFGQRKRLNTESLRTGSGLSRPCRPSASCSPM